ncbi:adenylate/guanylate cyclase domain-containing protein [Armatimonas sp.]|uniref:adenylate/guanylate cyclase domain-containing protein n=1 Tax=Armatimonas sp. TaxID=1872638 RepID=UPI003751E8E0
MNLPTGTVTFLFTDIEGSTRLWETHPTAMGPALARHDTLLRGTIEAHQGYVFKTIGDAFCAAFATVSDPLKAALEAQVLLTAEVWPDNLSLKVRMSLHTGAAESREGDYFGQPLNRVARLMAIGHGGQVLLSDATRRLIEGSLTEGIEGMSLLDHGSHRLKDLQELEQVFQLCHSKLPRDFPPLRSLVSHTNNLPQQLTVFVGREKEVREWSQLLRERNRRLFTMTGPGGVGKTRVAMQLGESVLNDFPDSVWWCDLEQAVTVEDAANRLALALNISLQPSPSVREQLFRHLHERRALLILDNFEQVAGGTVLIKELLAQTHNVVCLVTSRRTLELRGETVLELGTMPPRESFNLFVERALECRPDLALDEESLADVEELCRRLEGVPLAIELAAARIVGMTPRQMLPRLSERFRLLQSRSQELNGRQRALRGAV